MHILHVIPFYLPATSFGGPVAICSGMAEEMARRGHRVSVVTTDAASRSARVDTLKEEIAGVSVVRVRNLSQRMVRENLWLPAGLARAIDATLPAADVVHAHEFFTWLTYRAVERARRNRIPVVISPQGGLSTAPERGRSGVKRLLMRALGDRTLARCDAVHVVTRNEGEVCRQLGVPETKLRLIPNGVPGPPRQGDAARFRARHGLDGRPLALFVGRLLEGKGVDLLLAAAARLTGPDAPLFVLAGPAENRADLKAGWRGDHVLLTGILDRQGLDDAYSAASVFTLPSYSEGLPMSALDALAFGVPCLLTHGCNLPELEQAGAGLLIEPTVDALSDGLARMFGRRERWPAMRQAALRLARERYDLRTVHDALERMYEELRRAA